MPVTIVDLTGESREIHTEEDDAPVVSEMVADLLSSIRPVTLEALMPEETGRILVVDDLEPNRDLLARRLVRDGHRAETADGGAQALAMLKESEFDLVLLDLMMPDMNGFEMMARMKSDPDLLTIPVIMVSALDETDSVIRCIEAGADKRGNGEILNHDVTSARSQTPVAAAALA